MNGILLVNKPPGPTSHDIVDIVRDKLGVKKVGHAGTLDPFAEGLLILGVGKATRILEYFQHMDKVYWTTLKLGLITETFDITGEVREENPCEISAEKVKGVLESFVGEYLQVPPAYSARKYKGRKLYELARQGRIIRLPPRKVKIHWFEGVEYDEKEKRLRFTVKVSSGTYIRSLAMDVGYALGCGATVEELVRIEQGPFKLSKAVNVMETDASEMVKVLLSMNEALAWMPALVVDEKQARSVRNGGQVYAPGVIDIVGNFEKDTIVRILDSSGELLALAVSERTSKFICTLKRLNRCDRVAKLKKVFAN